MTKDDAYKNLAFVFAEKSRAALLRQALLDKKAKHFAFIPDSLLQKENQLKIDIAFYKHQLFESLANEKNTETTFSASWRTKLFAAERTYENLISELKLNYPNFYHLKYQTEFSSISEIRQRLQKDRSTLIEYFIGDRWLYIFTFPEKNFELEKIAIDSLFEKNIFELRNSLINRDAEKYFYLAAELYKKLIAPIKEKIKTKKIIIIPDGKLGYIPFETLLVNNSDSSNFQKAPFLLNDFQVRYSYSASLFFVDQIPGRSKNAFDFVGFAPVNFH